MSGSHTSATLPRPGSPGAWWLALRPKTLSAAAVPVLVGSACAHRLGALRPLPAAAALLGALLLQIGANLANDVFDHERGADTAARLGPPRAAAAGLLTGRQLRRGVALAFGLAALCGLYLVHQVGLAGLPGVAIVVIGVLSILAALAYTAGPYPLGYHGLGDLCVFIFFGPVAVCGTVLALARAVPPLALAAALPVGALATAILVVNNVRDVATDRLANKRTLAVCLGRRAGIAEYGALLPLLTAPLALRLLRRLGSSAGAALNPVLHATARLLLLFGGLWAVGIALG